MGTASTATRARRSRRAREERLDAVFKALSDRTRRALLARLSRGDSSIGELAAPHAMSLPAVSKHVRVLEQAGLVERSVEGRVHRCALEAAPLREADQWLAHYRAFWDSSLDSLAEYLEAEEG